MQAGLVLSLRLALNCAALPPSPALPSASPSWSMTTKAKPAHLAVPQDELPLGWVHSPAPCVFSYKSFSDPSPGLPLF